MAAHAPHTLHRIHTNASPPWNPLFLSRRIHEYEARALTEERIDGPLNNRWRPQRKREREREESSIGSSQNPPAARIRRGRRHLRRIKAGGEKTVDLALVYEAKKEKYFHCRVNLFEASFFLNLTSRPWTDFVKMNSERIGENCEMRLNVSYTGYRIVVLYNFEGDKYLWG